MNSTCGALSVRNGLNQGRFGSDNWLIFASDLGIFPDDCERRAVITSLPPTANTCPPFVPPVPVGSPRRPAALGGRVRHDERVQRESHFGIHAPTRRAAQLRTGPVCRGTKILLDYFVDEALIARFWRDFKEECAVCTRYFCEAVPFWGLVRRIGCKAKAYLHSINALLRFC